MSRGKRSDFPSRGAEFIDYTPPEPGWAYWEDAFEKEFSEKLRRQILLAHHDFRVHKKVYYSPERITAKKMVRLVKRYKKGKLKDKTVDVINFLNDNSMDFRFSNPQATRVEICDYVLDEFLAKPGDSMISRRKPEIMYTIIFFDLLSKEGIYCNRGSDETRRDLQGTQEAPTTPFLDFLGLLLWNKTKLNKAEVSKIQKTINRKKDYLA